MSEFVTRAEFELRMVRMESQIVDTVKVVARLSEDLADFRQETHERFESLESRVEQLDATMKAEFLGVKKTLETQHTALMSALLQLKPKP